jgi:hypothetical protein
MAHIEKYKEKEIKIKLFKKNNKIKFYSIDKNVPDISYPKPAFLVLPDWYKEQASYEFEDKRVRNGVVSQATIKKCIPIFDSITSGYIIFSTVDIYVSQIDGLPYYNWASSIAENQDAIGFHNNVQFAKYPKFKDAKSLPKFFNPWVIETPKGYSSFITQPLHRDLPFEILSGIVDTDSYNATVHFPFSLKDPKWEGVISSGTPIAQVIPFKREGWKMDIGSEKDVEKNHKNGFLVNSHFFNGYKKHFWKKKSFK